MRAISRGVSRHPLITIFTWLLILTIGTTWAITGFGKEGLFDKLEAGEPIASHSETYIGEQKLLKAREETAGFSRGDSVALVIQGVDLKDPRVAGTIMQNLAPFHAKWATRDDIISVADPFLAPNWTDIPQLRALANENLDGFQIVVTPKAHENEESNDKIQAEIAARLAKIPGELGLEKTPSHFISSPTTVAKEINDQVGEDLVKGEIISVPAALIVMIIVFGGFLAAGMPLIGSLASIAGGISILYAFTFITEVNSFAVNIVSVIGLGLSVDYGLLIVSRYREEVEGLDPARIKAHKKGTSPLIVEAIERTLSSAGKAVFFSAITIAVSISGLLFIRINFLTNMAIAAISVSLLALAASLTLIPACLALLGHRMVSASFLRKLPLVGRAFDLDTTHHDRGIFIGIARFVHRFPWPVLIGSVGILVVLALPLKNMNMQSSLWELLPPSSAQKAHFENMGTKYPNLSTPAMTVLFDAPAKEVSDSKQYRDIAAIDGVKNIGEVEDLGNHSAVAVYLNTQDHTSQTAAQVVKDIRATSTPWQKWVTGAAPLQIDVNKTLISDAPKALIVISCAIMALLFLMTGSVLMPIKAIIVNGASLVASLGVTSWIFTEGHLEGLLGFKSIGGVESYVVAVIVAFGLGLAMDYEVFLLSRVKEYWDSGHTNDESVEYGLQKSGRIITSAAIIIITVFIGFAQGELLVIKQVGIGLAITVFVDATLVRMLLVPATMTLLDKWNWWAPAPLRKVHEKLGISEH